jgi:putative hydrolase of the HAD superfamily
MVESPLSAIDAIALDLDGTLFAEAEWVIPALEHAAQAIGLDSQYAWELATRYVHDRGAADAGIFNHVLLGCGQSDTALNIRAFAAAANGYKPVRGSLQLLPGAEDALAELAERYRLAVIADGPVACQRGKVEGLGLERFSRDFIYSDEIDGIRSRRPDPRAYNELIRRLRVPAPRILCVADNPLKDFIRARQLGFVTIRVLTGEFAHYEYPSPEHAADFDISSIAQLPELLAQGAQPRQASAAAPADGQGQLPAQAIDGA